MAEDPKKYPASSQTMEQMLGISQEEAPQAHPVLSKAPSPADLPVIDAMPLDETEDRQAPQQANTHIEQAPVEEEKPKASSETAKKSGGVFKVLSKIAPYLVVFAIGVGLYYFYFSDFSFSKIFKTDIAKVASKEQTNKALEALKKKEAAAYSKWIGQFFFEVSDPKIVGMDNDVSGNGLTNFQKYLLNLNPKVYDTQSNGVADGQAIIDGKNPWTGQNMTDEQKRIAEAYFDNEAISSRITAAQSNRINPAYAPYVSVNSPYYQLGVSDANRGNLQEAQPQTTTNTPVNGQVNGSTAPVPAPVVPPARSAPRTGINNTSPFSSLNIDTNIPGKIEVPSQRINVPLIWSKDPKNFDNDLKYGVIHYTGTAMPGDIGTSYISGHSSGSVFDRNPYREVFARIGNMANGTPFAVTVTMQGGKQAVLHYVVGGRAEYAANDQRQFLQTPESVMALSTCWPINTTARRLVVFGTLTRVDK